MDLEELFLTRQSTREYCDKPVTDEQLEKICKLARLAPSAINGQPYKLYAINGEKAKLFAVNVQKDGANKWADQAAAFIVIEQLAPISIDRGTRIVTNEPFIGNDIGLLTAYMTLAAEEMGVQSCIIGLRDEKGIAAFLGLPEHTSFPLVVALGHKKEDYPIRQKNRRNFEDIYKLIK